MERLKTEPPRFHSPALGEMTQEEPVKHCLRHGEVRLAFYKLR